MYILEQTPDYYVSWNTAVICYNNLWLLWDLLTGSYCIYNYGPRPNHIWLYQELIMNRIFTYYVQCHDRVLSVCKTTLHYVYSFSIYIYIYMYVYQMVEVWCFRHSNQVCWSGLWYFLNGFMISCIPHTCMGWLHVKNGFIRICIEGLWVASNIYLNLWDWACSLFLCVFMSTRARLSFSFIFCSAKSHRFSSVQIAFCASAALHPSSTHPLKYVTTANIYLVNPSSLSIR